ncbi:unnamed protein product [Amoebophrya sp. A25]|nr:unnamed protein product [Amoebophrya sp. A25]|eukprot:GSA25T00022276001.1
MPLSPGCTTSSSEQAGSFDETSASSSTSNFVATDVYKIRSLLRRSRARAHTTCAGLQGEQTSSSSRKKRAGGTSTIKNGATSAPRNSTSSRHHQSGGASSTRARGSQHRRKSVASSTASRQSVIFSELGDRDLQGHLSVFQESHNFDFGDIVPAFSQHVERQIEDAAMRSRKQEVEHQSKSNSAPCAAFATSTSSKLQRWHSDSALCELGGSAGSASSADARTACPLSLSCTSSGSTTSDAASRQHPTLVLEERSTNVNKVVPAGRATLQFVPYNSDGSSSSKLQNSPSFQLQTSSVDRATSRSLSPKQIIDRRLERIRKSIEALSNGRDTFQRRMLWQRDLFPRKRGSSTGAGSSPENQLQRNARTLHLEHLPSVKQLSENLFLPKGRETLLQEKEKVGRLNKDRLHFLRESPQRVAGSLPSSALTAGRSRLWGSGRGRQKGATTCFLFGDASFDESDVRRLEAIRLGNMCRRLRGREMFGPSHVFAIPKDLEDVENCGSDLSSDASLTPRGSCHSLRQRHSSMNADEFDFVAMRTLFKGSARSVSPKTSRRSARCSSSHKGRRTRARSLSQDNLLYAVNALF